MAEGQQRSNSALWFGLLITLLGISSNFLYGFNGLPERILPWINVTLPLIGTIFVIVGVVRAFGRSSVYGGKVSGSIVALFSVFILAASVWFFAHARAVPRSGGAPRLGQQAPDFTLANSTGGQVSLRQLFTSVDANAPKTKAVLLIFYRGYW